jgi:hypothetical protein
MRWRSRQGRGQGGEGPGVLGRIPPRGPEHDAARADAYDHVAAHVQALSLLRPLQSVAVVGSAADEVAAGLVAALGRAGLRVVEAARAGEPVDADYVVVREPEGADVVVGASPAGARERPPAGAAGVVLTDASPAQQPEPERRSAGVVAAQALERAAASAPAPADDREAQLAARVEAVSKRERELARRAAELAQRERSLAAGDGGEAQLAARVEAVSRRERELARRVAELGARERAAEERERELERRRASIEELARTAVSRAGAAPPLHPVAAGDAGGPTIAELERLVADRAQAHPDRVDEWNSYLFFLREHADAHGRLAGNFRALVDDVFGDLLAAR